MATKITTDTLDDLTQWALNDYTDTDEFGATLYIDRETGEIMEYYSDPDHAASLMGEVAHEIHGDTERQLDERPDSLVEFENPIDGSLIDEIKEDHEKDGNTFFADETRYFKKMARELFQLNDAPFYAAVTKRLREYGFEIAK